MNCSGMLIVTVVLSGKTRYGRTLGSISPGASVGASVGSASGSGVGVGVAPGASRVSTADTWSESPVAAVSPGAGLVSGLAAGLISAAGDSPGTAGVVDSVRSNVAPSSDGNVPGPTSGG